MSCIKNRAENPKIISRADAAVAGLGRFFTGEPCKNGHVCERRTATNQCLDCILLCNRKAKEREPERFKQYSRTNSRKFRAENPGEDHAYYVKNKERLTAKSREWHSKNAEIVRKVKAAYKQRNPHKRNEIEARRRARKMGATPAWLTKSHIDEMAAIYAGAQQLGPQYEVDHIIPLGGKDVCGLHVPWNLRVITAAENASKNNRLLPIER